MGAIWRIFVILLLVGCFVLQGTEKAGWADIPDIKSSIGWASWYAKDDRTDPWPHVYNADGSRFDENALTCATRDRDFGRVYKVTNLLNGKSVIVLKRDFGPSRRYKHKKIQRVADLSKAAFKKIASLKKGLILVKLETIEESLN